MAAVARVLDPKLAEGVSTDPEGMYFTGSEWKAGPAPGSVPKTKVPVKKYERYAGGVDLSQFQDTAPHPSAQETVVFRSQYAAVDFKSKWKPEIQAEAAARAKAPDLKIQDFQFDDPYDEVGDFYKQFEDDDEDDGLEEVTIDGKPYVQFGADKAGRILKAGSMKGQAFSQVDIPPVMRVPKQPDVLTLYDAEGNLKKEGDAPLGVAYDAEGLPVPDWELVDCSKTAAGVDVIDENGRRRKGLEVRGALDERDYVLGMKRAMPVWGKRFGLVTKKRVGRFGSYTCADAKLALTTEDFGFRLAQDASKAPVPPLLKVRYGEVHNEPESIALFTGLSEIHMSHKEPIQDVHYMLQNLGYVCYNEPAEESEDVPRYWGEGIDINPEVVYRGDGGTIELPTQGPTYYSWLYRLPPFVEGLALEGEDGDAVAGPEALLRKKRMEALEADQEALSKERAAALRERCKEQATMPWYRDYFPNGEKDPETGEMINLPGTLPGEEKVSASTTGDDDKE